MNKRHILTMTLLLTALLMAGNAAAGVKVKGNVYGGGNEADVQMNTTVNIGGGIVEGNVYGGGNLGDVGKINDKSDKANYSWTGTDNQLNSPGGANNTGICSVHITGTTVLIGPSGENATADKDHGNVFGGGKGDDNSGFYCEKGMVYSTSVEISAGTVKGTVYGGGEVGRVEDNTIVTIGAAGANGDTNTPVINGDVFGAGKGLKTHGYSALVRGNPVVTVQGKTLVGGSVYGGGEIASVGRHKVKTSNSPLTPSDAPAALPVGMPYTLANTNLGKCTVTIKDNVTITGNVFGAGQGLDDYNYDSNNKPRRMGMSDWEDLDSKDLYHVFLQTLALATDTHVTIEGSANVNGSVFGGSESGFVQYDTNVTIKSGAIGDDVYGGGRGLTNNTIAGRVNGNTNVQILGGTITHDVYGGAALAKSNAGATSYTATVNLLGGTIGGNAYGGGLGDANTAADVGSTKVNLNGMALSEYNVNSTLYSSYLTAIDVNSDGDTTDEGVDYYIANKAKGCVVSNIFGANNVNGTPLGDVTVHVYATQNKNLSTIGNKVPLTFTEPETDKLTYWTTQATSIGLTHETIIGDTSDEDEKIDLLKAAIESNRYDVETVYGGGNKAAYIPTAAWNGTTGSKSQVIIDGCDYTSIDYVYGGGNAAPVPATNVTINSCYEINYLFGGGNGYGVGNPGADVGIYKVNGVETAYGTGVATTKLVGGTIHYVYGGSNTRGNVREETSLERTESNSCPLKIDEIYGAGQVAPMDGNVNIVLECMPDEFVDKVFGGAKNATIDGNVSLTVTSGKYGRVFGGNNEGGSINGSITVNAYEDGCKPLIIGELYGGGFNAPYSIWGCNDDDNNGTWTPNEHTSEDTPHVAESADAISVNVFSCTSIGKVFGGSYGETADVVGNTHVWINTMQGIVNGEKQKYATEPDVYIGKIGQVFGGGNAASVKGDITIDIGTATVYNYNKETEAEKIGVRIISGDDYLNATSNTSTSITAGIYGGGYAANVDGNVTLNIGTVEQNQGIKIGGDIFGGGYGETTHVTGNVTVNIGGTDKSGTPVGYANITGDVYGGSAKGKVNSHIDKNTETASEGKETQVNLFGGTISGDLYGGGLGEDNEETANDHEANVYGPVTVNVEGGKVTRVFGCNNVLGSPKSTATVNIHATAAPVSPATYTITSVYGGGNQAEYNGTGGVSVAMTGGYVNDVFGGGLGSSATVIGNTTVAISGGSVTNNVYGGGNEAHTNGSTSVTLSDAAAIGNDVFGGGSLAEVQGAVTLALNGGTVARDVYGGGALAETNTEYDASDDTKGYYITTVNLGDKDLPGIVRGTTIRGDLYGGGLGRLASGGDAAIAADVNGPVTVNVDGGLVNNVFGCNNINGSPQSTVTVNITGTANPTFEIALPIHNVYGGGNQAAYTFTDADHPQNLKVNISGGTMGNVFGGGLSADVAGGIVVNVTGGTVIDDVYGGGALANTNTGNWDATNNTWYVPAATSAVYYEEVKHLKTGNDVSSFYTESGGSYSQATGTYVDNTVYYKPLSFNPNVYNIAKADGHTTYTTTVSLRGGTIGNAYGGGLGQLDPAVAAMVYGDVEVTVNGTAFTNDVEYINGTSENVPKHGRVFGCNNLNGTPKGKVTVTVLATKRTDGSNSHVKGELEIQGVYGGGNLANYEPETYDKTDDNDHTGQTEFGQKTRVIIDGCSNVSINKVYGGGNAASVPISDVTIEGAFEIGYVFGGGNGGDKVNYGSEWVTNPGADVTHYANVMLKGGTIGQAFGGSDTRGTCGGTDVKQSTSPDCPLRIVNLYGAGNGEEATSDGDVNIEVSACGEGSEIQNVFGGSYKANIKGAVNLTIKSGIFTSVYGGNDRMGSIGGNITVNIEETDNCSKPIIIQNLYGGCYQTAYPGPNAQYKDGNGVLQPFTSGNITVNVKSATRIDRIFGGSENGAVTGNTTVNINMVEGSQSGHNNVALPSYYAETGAKIPSNITVTDTDGYIEVNGLVTEQAAEADHTKEASSVVGYYTKSGDTYSVATGYAQDNVTYYKKAVKGNIAPGIGTIGEVYGGGNRGNVSGDAAVNIVTEESVNMVSLNASRDVLGAHIDGNVYGGGNLADVNGNTDVNICVKKNDSDVYEALSEGTKHVTIGGNIYGGGKGDDDTFECEKGMVGVVNTNDGSYAAVDKGTHVRIGNGTIGTSLQNGTLKAGTGNVYGGGEVGRVEYHSVVTIGLTPKTGVASSAPEILGNVFGGGQGVETHGYSALLRGNTTVTVQQNAKVRNSVYGGGELGTIGRFFVRNVNDGSYEHKNDTEYADIPTGMPYALRDGGKCTVNIKDNVEIGPTDRMTMPTFAGNVFGGGKGVIPKVYDYSADDDEHKPRRISVGNVKDYFKNNDAYLFFIETLALDDETYVTIGDNAFIKGSVYGGSENGRVLNDTHVTIAGGQIGWGKNAEGRHPAAVWDNDTPTTDLECPSWTYDKNDPAPYDPFAHTDAATYDYTLSNFSVIPQAERLSSSEGGKRIGKDGHTYYGNVFGGGSGKDPYAPGKWHRKGGAVGGNATVNITGGHILTNIYGGNEFTDVGTYGSDGLTPVSGGKCTVNMTGGTLGVPRTQDSIIAHPVTCYIFGAGKGDQRIFFNTWTNVISTEVNITGTARIYGSTFGGGEDGHVMNDAVTNIGGSVTIGGTTYNHTNVKIGTTGTSYVDGNVFGGGRGFSGEALTAGSTGGNADVTISGGTMLGSVYGGGRLASIGIGFTSPDDDSYGQLTDDTSDSDVTHGRIRVTISGGTIGNDVEGAQYGGNVFGAGMGRNTLLNGSLNPLWPKVATSKTTTVNISGGTIKKNVYGGAEFGVVRNQATVTISGTADIKGSVYGGGKGSDDYQDSTTIKVGGYDNLYYSFTPMLWNGIVAGNTIVNIEGGKIGQNVYGGGELASVGLIDFVSDKDGNFTNMPKHESLTNGFGLSWPYKFTYHAAAPNDDAVGGKTIGGKATVTITGGHIGSATWNDGTGYVFGGGKGMVDFGITSISEQRYTEAFCANVKETEVNVNFATPSGKNSSNIGAETNCIMGAVYGGGEDGHVYNDAKVNITGGLIGLSVYGAGKGISTYKGYLRDQNTKNFKNATEDLYSWTAGKVYGNATVIMTGGHVLNNVYGGGYLGSVGKGNYAGGADDYYKEGYGETLQGNLWASTTEGDNAWQFLNSGKATVKVLGGTIGTLNGTYGNVGGSTDPTPSGMVFGGSRGQSAEDVMLDPRYEYAPNFYLGYVNNTEVTIGTTEGGAPRIYSQVFGGGRDGHVRGDAHVIVNNGIIGQTYAETDAVAGSTADYQRYHRGNVYGSGSGLGQWTTGKHGMSSGSVTRNTTVDINGGTIYNNVYGGGALSSVGPPRLDPEKDYAPADWSKCVVNINGGTIGNPTVYDEHEYGGCVYGASRGNDFATDESPDNFATVLWTLVNINDGNIAGNVYGGAKGGLVWKDTEVNLKGGRVYHDAYGGGQGTMTPNIAANVGGTTVELNKNVATTDKGCIVERIFGCNDLNGTPRGHVKVHVFATQNKATNDILHKIAPAPYSTKRITSTTPEEGYKTWLQRLIGIAKPGGTVLVGLDETVISAAETVLSSFSDVDEDVLAKDNDKKKSISDAALTVIKQIERQHDYDVKAVYGGGNLAIYEPYGPAADNTEADFKATKEYTEVIIEGCDVTSIKQVYGGGNAASVPATNVSVKSVFIIDELFGGGNGFDHYTINDKWYENPGANIGYYATEEHDTDDTTNNGSTEDKRYRTVAKPNSSTKEDRQQYYAYGSGRAETTVTGGHIHTVYGGSNEKGNIREVALSQYQKSGTCTLVTDESYGGSKRAEMDGEIQVVMDCVEDGGIYFGGSQNADINNNVTINITNGTYDKVYGGNNKAGTINGAITINIEEKGCTPIKITELYGGGYYAPYSVYGYKKKSDGTYETITETDPTDNTKTIESRIPLQAGDEGALATPHRDPYINIISATSIGTIYGGGDQALVIGSPHVNVNMQEGIILEEYAKKLEGYSSLTVDNGGIDADGNKILPIGTIGSIYGGGNLASVEGNTFVDIGTGSWYNYKEKAIEAISRKEANITGNVYGGGKGKADNFTCDKAMVGHDGGGVTNDEGNTSVTIGYGTIGGSVYGGGEIGRVENNADVTIGIASGTGPVIMGDVYGAGQGVPTHGYSGLTRGNTTVTVQGSSKVMGSVYGGGEMASVGSYNIATTQALADEYHVEVGMPYGLKSGGKNTVVVTDSAEIGPDNMVMHNKVTGKPDDKGHVFGAGKGVVAYDTDNPGRWYMKKTTNEETGEEVSVYTWEAYGEANESDYLKYTKTLGLSDHTEVTIEGDAFIKGSVYGGAENGHVRTDTHVIIDGNCQIGNGYVQMTDDGTYLDSLASPLIPIAVNRRYTAAEWAGRKLITTDADPVELRTLAATYYKSSLPECASWRYGHDTDGDGKNDVFASYDKFASTVSGHEEEYPLENGQSEAKSTDGGRRVASDGHTFYGNVFGGGSGFYPYKAGRWNFNAGSVGGNCVLEIKGGHILTNAYGASEFANIGGSTTITMTGGTIGVPRTLGQIAAHPVTCYLFGAGKGDQRLFFNKETNVQDATITVSGDTIYGSVFGGGEDGHVLGNVTMNINSGAWIGTWGTSYVDGNVFGGGRGFSGEALTAGNVAGTITMNINGGTMLGSIYGGGRLASVGYGLFLAEGDELEHYGEMIEDGKKQVFNDDRTTSIEDGAGVKHGHIDINIKGGTIGNDNEYKYFTVNVDTDGKTSGEIIRARDAALAAQKTANDMPDTDFELSDSTTNGTVRTYDYRLTHTKGGNVFCGSMGRMYYLDGTPIPNWTQLGNVKSTKLHITGGTIKSNVYGGGELGFVRGKHAVQVGDSLSTEILIDGGTIGTEVKDGNTTKYAFGSVYGGGRGSTIERFAGLTGLNEYPKYYAAIIEDSTQIVMNDGAVKASIYGGGEVGNVKGSANVTINGGTIGIDHQGDTYFGGARIGNVFGGGSGDRTISRCGAVHKNTTVNINQAAGKTTRIYHNVYGGGSYGSVGTYDYEMGYEEQFGANKVQDILNVTNGTSRVNITGGTIGINGNDNGMVFGSGRGEISAPGERDKRDNFLGWVNNSHVTIGTKNGGIGDTQPKVRGSVYGSGENGHNFNDATVNIHSGVIGITEGSPVTYKGKPCSGPDYPYRGNVYGAGCGTDTYIDLATGEEKYNPWAGIVFGNTTVNIDGGLIVQNVYGGGSMGSVGKIKVNYAMMADPNNAQQLIPDRTKPDTASVYKHADVRMITDANGVTKEVVYGFGLSWPYEFTFDRGGKATINITGGHLGIYGHDGGDVFGAARGDAGDRYKTSHLARVNETEVNIKYPTTANLTDTTNLAAALITGSVHGSGEDGYVYGDTHVTLTGGLVCHSLYGGGKGKGTYTQKLLKIGATAASATANDYYDAEIYSLISGKVMGNTYVNMSGGRVMRNVYGGGNIASVGKGNYAGGPDDYYPAGYGETLTGENNKLWTSTFDDSKEVSTTNKPDTAYYFLNSGKTNVVVTGGTIGYIDSANPDNSFKNGLPYGNVFGGSTGEAAPNVDRNLSPRYHYCPSFFSGYVNETDVTIGTEGSETGPVILGSVYGGGQDGHVRRWTNVKINSGTIGLPFNAGNKTLLKTSDPSDEQWLYRGNVYGAGSGISQYKYNKVTTSGTTTETGYSTSAGSVSHFTQVEVKGGTIYRNVLGGGSLATVGPPKIGAPDYAAIKGANAADWGKQSLNMVTIGGGKTADNKTAIVTIGEQNGVNAGYGGNVFGGSRGEGEATLGSNFASFATSIWTKVLIRDGANILGNVFGGGNAGEVMKDTDVQIGDKKVVTPENP